MDHFTLTQEARTFIHGRTPSWFSDVWDRGDIQPINHDGYPGTYIHLSDGTIATIGDEIERTADGTIRKVVA